MITGCTGFLGKVILEKIMRSCSEFNKIFIMVRPKRKINPMDRVYDQIFGSACFKRVKEMHGGELGFLKFIKGKIIPIQGDLVIE